MQRELKYTVSGKQNKKKHLQYLQCIKKKIINNTGYVLYVQENFRAKQARCIARLLSAATTALPTYSNESFHYQELHWAELSGWGKLLHCEVKNRNIKGAVETLTVLLNSPCNERYESSAADLPHSCNHRFARVRTPVVCFVLFLFWGSSFSPLVSSNAPNQSGGLFKWSDRLESSQ